jgi:flagellar motor protein MotB
MLVRLGIEPSRLVTEGFGEQRPRDPDTSVYARRKNRRVEFVVLERTIVGKRVDSAAELLPPGGKP